MSSNATAAGIPATQRLIADYVVTCDQDFNIYSPGVIDMAGSRIAWVGPLAQASDGSASDSTMEQPRHPPTSTTKLDGVLMPGLVNTHCHTPMTLMRGAGDGLALQAWLSDVMWPREIKMTLEDTHWGMVLGAAEMLLAGVTTSCEMYLDEEALVTGAKQVGTRLVMTPGIVLEIRQYASLADRLAEIIDFHKAVHDPTGLITTGIAPHSAYVLGVEGCVEVSRIAQEHDLLVHIHIGETSSEAAELEEKYGTSVVQVLADHGVFEARTLSAHSIWLSDQDLDTFAEFNVAVAHCPVSNMKLGSGVAKVLEMRNRQITVGLGTDGPGSNNTLDLWEEVKLASMLARIAASDASTLSSPEVLQMATRQGAQAVGLPDAGSLEPGNFADIIHISLDEPSFTPICEDSDLIAHLAWSGGSRNVTDVWVAGTRVVQDGQCQTIDLDQARSEVQQRAVRLARAE